MLNKKILDKIQKNSNNRIKKWVKFLIIEKNKNKINKILTEDMIQSWLIWLALRTPEILFIIYILYKS